MSTGWRARSVCVNKLKKKKSKAVQLESGVTLGVVQFHGKKKQFERAAG